MILPKKYIVLFLLFIAFGSLFGVDEPPKAPLQKLEEELLCQLTKVNIPPEPWIIPFEGQSEVDVLDVAIIGGGMAGQVAAFALLKEGIINIKIFDENCCGREGPWKRYARMPSLRSRKGLPGPALDLPGLTCHSWYEACFDEASWQALETIPTEVWGDYLHWYERVLNLPIQHETTLKSINPVDGYFELTFIHEGNESTICARKVILATGREGFGGKVIPFFLLDVPKQFYMHAIEEIRADEVEDKSIAIIGAGASAFDSAAFALENGAKKVDMLIRRKEVPAINKFSQLSFPGILHGFYELPDAMRIDLLAEAFACGIPPPKEALDRIKELNAGKRFSMHLNAIVEDVKVVEQEVILKTTKGTFKVDCIIAATGFAVDGWHRPELQSHMPFIKLWDEKILPPDEERAPILKSFPYLGNHFQFIAKQKDMALYLKNIYCFNFGAFLSHGLICSDILGISYGANRLAKGIAADFFIENFESYKKAIEAFEKPRFSLEDLP